MFGDCCLLVTEYDAFIHFLFSFPLSLFARTLYGLATSVPRGFEAFFCAITLLLLAS